MEYRDDLEQILLDGLSSDDRRLTEQSMASANANKLAQLQSERDADASATDTAEDS
jgi:hypothetical protein